MLHSRGDRMQDFKGARHLAAGITARGWWRWTATTTSCSRTSRPGRCFAGGAAVPRPRGSTRDRGRGHRGRPRANGDAAPRGLDQLSPREVEILRLAADGLDNDEIATSLTLSVRTVERHLSNVYAKLDLHGKSARTAAVARLLTRA